MVRVLCVLGCLVSAFAGGWVLHIAPKDDPIVWLVLFLLLLVLLLVFLVFFLILVLSDLVLLLVFRNIWLVELYQIPSR